MTHRNSDIPPNGDPAEGVDRAMDAPGRFHIPGGMIAVERRADLGRAAIIAGGLLGPARGRLMKAARAGDRRAMHELERKWASRSVRLTRTALRVLGATRASPGPYVVAPLHEGFFDAVALLTLPLDLVFVVRAELLAWPHLGPYLTASGQLAIDPEDPAPDMGSLLDGAERAIARGESVVMFPQGTILGIETAFQPGAAWLAKRLGVEILPVVISGSHRIWEQPFSPTLRFGQPMYLEVLDPIEPDGLFDVEPVMKRAALGNGHALPRRFVPERDGYWDGYAYEIDPSFTELAGAVARHRAGRAARLDERS